MTTTTVARTAIGRTLRGMLAALGLALAGLVGLPTDEAAAGIKFEEIIVSSQAATTEPLPETTAVQKVREAAGLLAEPAQP